MESHCSWQSRRRCRPEQVAHADPAWGNGSEEGGREGERERGGRERGGRERGREGERERRRVGREREVRERGRGEGRKEKKERWREEGGGREMREMIGRSEKGKERERGKEGEREGRRRTGLHMSVQKGGGMNIYSEGEKIPDYLFAIVMFVFLRLETTEVEILCSKQKRNRTFLKASVRICVEIGDHFHRGRRRLPPSTFGLSSTALRLPSALRSSGEGGREGGEEVRDEGREESREGREERMAKC